MLVSDFLLRLLRFPRLRNRRAAASSALTRAKPPVTTPREISRLRRESLLCPFGEIGAGVDIPGSLTFLTIRDVVWTWRAIRPHHHGGIRFIEGGGVIIARAHRHLAFAAMLALAASRGRDHRGQGSANRDKSATCTIQNHSTRDSLRQHATFLTFQRTHSRARYA